MRTFAAMMMSLSVSLLSLPSASQAADKPVPLICLTQSQAAQVYKGKKLKYRQIGSERCWYAGKTRDKSEFAGRAERPPASALDASRQPTPRAPNGEQTRALASHPAETVPARVQPVAAGTPAARDPTYEEMLDDAFLALTGKSEIEIERMTFVKMWDEIMRDARGR